MERVPALLHANAFHGNVNLAHFDAGHAFQLIFDDFYDRLAHHGYGNAVFHHDVEVYVQHILYHAQLNALAQVFAAQPFHNAVLGALGGHGHDAVAFQHGVADYFEHYVFRNVDGADIILDFAFHRFEPPDVGSDPKVTLYYTGFSAIVQARSANAALLPYYCSFSAFCASIVLFLTGGSQCLHGVR